MRCYTIDQAICQISFLLVNITLNQTSSFFINLLIKYAVIKQVKLIRANTKNRKNLLQIISLNLQLKNPD